MRILHTSDWHIGHTLHAFDRTYEHECFFQWLLEQLATLQVDVLLVAGDVFDTTNPAAASQKLLHEFLASAKTLLPLLNIVIVAGNHDSPGRLEAPSPILEKFGVTVVGTVSRSADGTLDLEKLLVPLRNRQGVVEAWCLAIPFLRASDLPITTIIEDVTEPFSAADNVLNAPESADTSKNAPILVGDSGALAQAAVYARAFEAALARRTPNQAIVAMGHLHVAGAAMSPDSERRIVSGGLEGLPSSIFDPRIAYVALGHLHLAQRVGGQEHHRYSGSPFPMSFSETRYRHQVVVFDLEDGLVANLDQVFIPRFVELIQIPSPGSKPCNVESVLTLLQSLELPEKPVEAWPYLQVRVHLEAPEPALRTKIETALASKSVRLARIEISTPAIAQGTGQAGTSVTLNGLDKLKPEDVFVRMYAGRYATEPPPALLKAFLQLGEFELGRGL